MERQKFQPSTLAFGDSRLHHTIAEKFCSVVAENMPVLAGCLVHAFFSVEVKIRKELSQFSSCSFFPYPETPHAAEQNRWWLV